MDKHGLNTEVRDCVGGEGGVRWCVENSNPLTLSLSPLGGARGTEHIPRVVFIRAHPRSSVV